MVASIKKKKRGPSDELVIVVVRSGTVEELKHRISDVYEPFVKSTHDLLLHTEYLLPSLQPLTCRMSLITSPSHRWSCLVMRPPGRTIGEPGKRF
jgi:hypothetical protein